jgi:hypothetical protein
MGQCGTVLVLLGALACGAAAQNTPEQQEKPKKPKGKDGPGDAERRKKLLEGESAADAKALVETNNPLHLDAVAKFFNDEKKPLKERLAALQALRLLQEQDDEEYKRVYPAVKSALSLAASRGHSMSAFKPEEEEMLLEAISWHADMKYDHAMYAMQNYVDPDFNATLMVRLPERIRVTSARLLAAYAPEKFSREVLWSALVERREPDALREACHESLKKFMKDLRERVLELKPHAKDEWLRKLQLKLMEK